MASLKLCFFEERRRLNPVSGRSERHSSAATGTTVMRLDNARAKVAMLIRETVGGRAKVSLGGQVIEIRALRPRHVSGTVSVWPSVSVTLADGSDYELRLMADILTAAFAG